MQLVTGSRLGPYEILGPLGAGGMGEVYRAHDSRLNRDVALKIVAASEGSRDDRFRRFEQEAKAVAALNHPHILAVHDVGSENGTAFVVFELLEGQTLRDRLEAGAIPLRKAVEYGVQIAQGLAAAHSHGVVHRDLKPGNLFLTKDGQLKILDFGLAKLTETLETNEALEGETRTATDSGIVLGTAGYISPEQARGKRADARSDIFALGAVLYEMICGRPAFDGETSADRVSAILHHDPPELTSADRETVSPGLDRIIRRCLEKDPEERFQSARDVAFALQALGGSGSFPLTTDAPSTRTRWVRWLAASAVACAVGVASGLYIGRARYERPPPNIRQLSFGRGAITGARFLPGDEQVIVYSASWDGRPNRIFQTRLDGSETRSLGLPPAKLLSVSSRGELAILLTRPDEVGDPFLGTLATVPLAGAIPRSVLEDVEDANWSADGQELAVVRQVNGEHRLEYPIGKVLLRFATVPGSHGMRVSPRGDKVAINANGGMTIVDREGSLKTLRFPREGFNLVGLAWSPSGDAVWVTGATAKLRVWELGLDGSCRQVYIAPGGGVLHDIGKSGAALLHHGYERCAVRVKLRGDQAERELELGVGAVAIDITRDGTQVLGTNQADGRDYLYSANEGDPVLPPRFSAPTLFVAGISPDGKWVLDGTLDAKNQARLMPIGPGDPRVLPLGQLQNPTIAFLGADQIYWMGQELGDPAMRGFLQEIATGAIRPVTPPGVEPVRSPVVDGAVLGRRVSDGTLVWCPLQGGELRPTGARVPPNFSSLQTSLDGRWTYLNSGGIPMHIERIDLRSGLRELWKTLAPPDLAGVVWMPTMVPMTSGGEAYAYSYLRVSQDLFLVEGLK